MPFSQSSWKFWRTRLTFVDIFTPILRRDVSGKSNIMFYGATSCIYIYSWRLNGNDNVAKFALFFGQNNNKSMTKREGNQGGILQIIKISRIYLKWIIRTLGNL